VGGALMTAQIGSANIDRYDIFLSLSLLMLTVVGGIGYVSGALFGGLAAGVLFVAMQNTFDKLGTDYSDFEGLFEFLANLTLVLPALMGVSIGRNPTGAVERIVESFAPLRRAWPVLVAGIGVLGGAYLMARDGSISNWWFLVVSAVVIGAMPAVAQRLAPPTPAPGVAVAGPAELPLELVGVIRPYQVADREMLDAALGLPAPEDGGGGHRPAATAAERMG
jgi:hypothetical protein